MPYNYNLTGERTVLDVIANTDESILNVRIDGLHIIKMSFDEFFTICQQIGYNSSYNDMVTLLFKNKAFVNQTNNSQEFNIIVLESNGDYYTAFRLFDVLKLYKSLDIYSCYSVNYAYKNDAVKFGGIGKVLNIFPEHSFVFSERFSLTTDEVSAFPAWYSSHLKMLSRQEANSVFTNAVSFYIKSFSLSDPSASFLMLMIVLEMFFCNENTELSYRIKRGCSYFLSNNRKEMDSLSKKIAKLYNVRSKYVHTGASVKLEQLYEMRELTRKVLVTMFDRKMYSKDFDLKKFREDLTYSGYEK